MQFDRSQFLKGFLEGMILLVIAQEPTYGYVIREKLEAFGAKDMKEGAIYPVLLRLEKKGVISSDFRASPSGPSRKYYALTEEGAAYLNDFRALWHEFSTTMTALMEEGLHDE